MEFKEVVHEATKAAPPATVASLTFFGIQLSDAVLILTLVYVILQLFFILRDKWWRDDGRKS